jgi:hypothetical protein
MTIPERNKEDRELTEKQLMILAYRIGYVGKKGRYGWKIFLKDELKLKQHSNVTSWIKRGVPKHFKLMLEDINAGYPQVWQDILDGKITLESLRGVNKTGEGEEMVRVIGKLVDNYEGQLAEARKRIAELEAEVLLLRGVKKNHHNNGV